MKKIAIWAATVVLALYVIAAGGAKLAGVERVLQSFATLGLPAWFGPLIGACEVVGGIALFWRPLSAPAATGLLAIMVGALYYHVVHTPLAQAVPAAILIVCCLCVAWSRKADAFRFGRQAP